MGVGLACWRKRKQVCVARAYTGKFREVGRVQIMDSYVSQGKKFGF